MTVGDYGRMLDQQNWLSAQMTLAQALIPAFQVDKPAPAPTDQDGDIDEMNETFWGDGVEQNARLSPQSLERIYDLYLEGWKIRDICRRFGIVPPRAKFIIWSRAQFYAEVLPKYGFAHYLSYIDARVAYGQEFGYMDYGIDIDQVGKGQEVLAQIHCWNYKLVDVAKPNELEKELQQKAIQRIEQRTDMTSKYLHLDHGTHSTGSHMYYLRDWKILRGKGSDYWHLTRKTFKPLMKKRSRHVRY